MGQSRIKVEKFAALRQQVFFGAIGQKAKVTDAHEAVGEHVEQEAADEFVGIKDDGLFSISIFSISVAQGDLAVVDSENAVIGESDTVGVAAEVIENGLRRRVFSHKRSNSFAVRFCLPCLPARFFLPRSVLTDQETFHETPD